MSLIFLIVRIIFLSIRFYDIVLFVFVLIQTGQIRTDKVTLAISVDFISHIKANWNSRCCSRKPE